MKTLAKIIFWSFLIFGLGFIFLGVYLLASDRASQSLINALLLAGMGQLGYFTILLFYLYRGKLKSSRKAK